ncbi:hypothetical protein P0F65_18185 [Sphingomonas sp. I4]
MAGTGRARGGRWRGDGNSWRRWRSAPMRGGGTGGGRDAAWCAGLAAARSGFGEAWDAAIGTAHALVEEGLLRRMLALLAAGDGEEGGEAGVGTTGLSITPPLSATEVQFYLKLLARRDALARVGDAGSDTARASAAETDAALERALDGLARRRLKGMA